MKNQVLSIKQMQHLKKLGVNTDNASAVLIIYTENGEELGWDEVENHGKNEPLYEWYNNDTETWESAHIRIYDAEMGDYDHSYREECGTFTLQDMFEMMPVRIVHKGNTGFLIMYSPKLVTYDPGVHSTNGDNCLDVAYKMLCWLAENKLLGKEEEK